jgi:hypothetical protein
MKLELKHLAPYLPYELKVVHTNYIEFGKVVEKVDTLTGLYKDCCTFDLGADWYFNTDENDCSIKPILVPLKELQYYSNGIKHLGYRTDKNNYLNLISDIICKRAGYDLMEMCFKEHIDVFCLIEKGLAIDKNTLSK